MRFLPSALLLTVLLAAGGEGTRVLWSGADVNFLGAPSPDGKLLSCVDAKTGNLAVRDLASGKMRLLTSKAQGSPEFAWFSVFSRDGRKIAYSWMNREGFYELRVVDADGSNARTVYRNPETRFVQPSSWSPDGSRLLTLFFRRDNISQIVMVSLADGSVQVLRSLPWVYPKRMEISADGRSVVFDSFAGTKPGPRDLFLIDLKDLSQRKLTSTAADEVFPTWKADGSGVVFLSDREGEPALYEMGLDGSEAKLLEKGFDRALLLGLNRDQLFWARRKDDSTINLVVIGAEGVLKLPGSSPALGNTGGTLAYLAQAGSENFAQPARAIRIRNLETNEDRELKTSMAHVEAMSWSPDDSKLLASGSDGKGRSGLFLMDARHGTTRLLASAPDSDYRGIPGAWLSDEEVIYALGDAVHALKWKSGESREVLKGEQVRAIAVHENRRSSALLLNDAVLLMPEKKRVALARPASQIQAQGNGYYVPQGDQLFYLNGDGSRLTRIELEGYRGGAVAPALSGPMLAFVTGGLQNEILVSRFKQ
jgi:Tol biopolymer transport system component